MTIRHHAAPVRRRPPPADGRGGPGYVLVMFALLLLPLMAFVGLSVDVGSWYNRASEIQRGADAAALAGAVWLPDAAKAVAAANEAASRNGFTSGVDNVTVTVSPASARKLQVTISDSAADSYFWKLFGPPIRLTRSSFAEYVLPVPLGSPTNYFGNDPVGGTTNTPARTVGLWGNIHGAETNNFNGDRFAAGCRGNSNCSGNSNNEYRGGYSYTVDVPAGTTTMGVQVYDAALTPKANEQTSTGDADYSTDGVTTTWEFFDQDSSVLDLSNNPSLANAAKCGGSGFGKWIVPQGTGNATYDNKWATLCNMTTSVPAGRYVLRVNTTGVGDGANRYALRLTYTGAQPTLSAYGDMSMFNNQLTVNPEFYLARVDPIHKGKTLQISLYDPGEIGVPNAKMKLLDPTTSASAASCTMSVFDNPADVSPSSSLVKTPCEIATTDGSGNGLYNGKLVQMEFKLSNTYTCDTTSITPGCWWKIRYDLGGATTGSPADTTTWSASIKGDPVHLVAG